MDTCLEKKYWTPLHIIRSPMAIIGRAERKDVWVLRIKNGPVFQPLFKQSVDIGVIPPIWKTSIVVPVPKMSSPSELNHFRPVALTSIDMKCFERLILSRILPHVQSQLDPYQFNKI